MTLANLGSVMSPREQIRLFPHALEAHNHPLEAVPIVHASSVFGKGFGHAVHHCSKFSEKVLLGLWRFSLSAQSRHHCIDSRFHGAGIPVVAPVVKDAPCFLNVGSDLDETCRKVAATLILAKQNKSVSNGPVPLAEYPSNHRTAPAACNTDSPECRDPWRGPPTERLKHPPIMAKPARESSNQDKPLPLRTRPMSLTGR